MCVCVCVCVCRDGDDTRKMKLEVCVYRREREGGKREKGSKRWVYNYFLQKWTSVCAYIRGWEGRKGRGNGRRGKRK